MSVSVQELSSKEPSDKENSQRLEQLQEREKNVQRDLDSYNETNAEYLKYYNDFRSAESRAFKKLQSLYQAQSLSIKKRSEIDQNLQDQYNQELNLVDNMRSEVFELQKETLSKLEVAHRAHVGLLLDLLNGYKSRVDELEKTQSTRPNNV